MNTYESFDEKEVRDFFDSIHPTLWQTYTYKDPISFRTVYVLKWIKND